MRAGLAGLLLVGLAACDSTSTEPTSPLSAEAGESLRALVGEPVVLDGSGSQGGVAFRWGTGDGVLLDGQTVTHTYEAPGRYAAVLEVTGADGARITDTTSVLVTLPPAEASPSSGGPLSVAPDGAVWVVVPEAGALVRVSSAGSVDRVPVCVGASSVVAGPERIVVTCPEQDRVEILDAQALGDQAEHLALPPGSRPTQIVSQPSEQGALGPWIVSLPGRGRLAWIGLDGRLAREVELGGDPSALVALPDGSVVAGRLRAVADQSVLFKVESDGEVRPLELTYQPGPDTDTNTGGVPHLIAQLAVSPDGGTLFAPGVLANTARGPTRSGEPLTFETTVRAQVSVVDLHGWTEHTRRRKSFDDQGRALAVAVSPRGDLVWVSHPGTGVVHAIDAFAGATRRSLLGVGRGVTGLAVTDDGHTLLAYAWLDRELHAYDLRADPPSRTWSVGLLEREPLPAQILRGKQLFWEAGDPRLGRAGYMACAHCHPDGDQDGLVWDFTGRGEGVRNTLSLLGRAGTGHGPLHWSANFDEVQDFEHDLRGPNGGRGLLTDADFEATRDPLGAPKAGRSADLDALAAYVASLNETPTSPFEAPVGGAQAFEAAGCGSCHPAPTYTDSGAALHDVGTLTDDSGGRLGGPLTGLDTPTLLGAWSTPPYLHDGSASSIEDAIAAHRSSAGLSDEEIRLIAGFVRSL